MNESSVTLRRSSDEKVFTVDVNLLSEADQAYIKGYVDNPDQMNQGGSLSLSEQKKHSDKIDQIIGNSLTANEIEVNAPISDEVFLRRVYLDIAGRIPTLEEYDQFMAMTESTRRNELIDQLLDSAAYVSNSFNYWADTLRATSSLAGVGDGANYINWIKDSIANNKPYDQFVREMLASEGAMYKPGNGATGWYMKDLNMPLDNLAQTMEVFLGTSMLCAQCHDHPKKKWTQMDFFKLAAFTHGTATNGVQVDQSLMNDIIAKVGKSDVPGKRHFRARYVGVYNSGTGDIKLPYDYQYDDGEPDQVIQAEVPFGPVINIDYESSNGAKERNEQFPFDKDEDFKGLTHVNSRATFADWVTSPDNPMFTKTIVNRLWDRVMGVPLIGDLLDLPSPPEGIETQSSRLTDERRKQLEGVNPELTEFLISLMEELEYDQKMFLRVIYKSQSYQRAATHQVEGEYYFPGPVMKRLSAEKIHDSLLALRVEDPDASIKMESVPYHSRVYGELIDRDAQGMIDFAEDEEEILEELKVGQEGQRIFSEILNRSPLDARASEQRSPGTPGRMLEVFGQSSREAVDDASTESSIPQALKLMNHADYSLEKTKPSGLYQRLNSEESLEERIQILYKAVLSRQATSSELSMVKRHTENGLELADIYWGLVNSHEFRTKM